MRALDGPAALTLVRVAEGERLGDDAVLWVGACDTAEGHHLTVRLGRSAQGAAHAGPPLVLDLRLAPSRRIVREMAAGGGIDLIEVAGPGDDGTHAGRIALGPARDLFLTAAARAGEWCAGDPSRGLASSIPWRLERDPHVPQLVPGARLGDAPVLLVPAGGAPASLDAAAIAALAPRGTLAQRRLLGQALSRRALTLAEVALGPRPALVALRPLALSGA